MRAVTAAMLWELWRVSRWELAIRIVGASFWVILVGMFLGWAALENESQRAVLQGIAMLMLFCSGLFSTSWLGQLDNTQAGFSFRLGFTRPISTRRLVVLPIAYFAVTSALCFLIPAALLRLAVGFNVDFAGPAAGIACAVVCLIAAMWSPGTYVGKLIALFAVAGAEAMLLARLATMRAGDDPILLAIGRPEFFAATPMAYVLMAFIAVIATTVTVFAVGRQRHGESVRTLRWSRLTAAWDRPVSRSARPFSGPFQAQLWYEMRRAGFKMIVTGLSVAVLIAVFLSAARLGDPTWREAPAAWLFALAMSPFAYLLIGADWTLGLTRKQGAAGLSLFDATRSLRNDQLIAVKLATIVIGTVAGVAALAIAAAIDATLYGDWPAWQRFGDRVLPLVSSAPVRWSAAAIVSAVFLFLAGGAICIAFGLWVTRYRKHFAWFAGCTWLVGVFAVWDVKHGGTFRLVWIAIPWAMTTGFLGLAGYLIWKSLRTGSLAGRWLLGAIVPWAVFVVFVTTVYLKLQPQLPPIPASALAAAVAMLTLPLAATAAAPMALASHRHE